MKINYFIRKEKVISHEGKAGDELSVKGKSILDQIEKIVEISKKNGIEKCLTIGKKHLDFVTKKLGINPIQAILFSHFLEKSNDSNIHISEIAQTIKCSNIKIIKYMNECEELEKKKLIRCSRGNEGVSFRIPRNVWDSLRKNDEFRPEKLDNLTISKFFITLEEIFDERSNHELTYESMATEILDLINQNMHLQFCKKIMSYNLYEGTLILLVCFCHLFGNNDDDNIGANDLKFLYDEKFIYCDIKTSLVQGSHVLIKSKYIVYTNNDGFVNTDSWKLSDMAKKELLSELVEKHNYQKNLILFDKIKPKNMFYNEKETEAIGKLRSLLQDDNYHKIQERLDGKGMRKGFACLFSGGPGTGKTETAWQIARETKRNVMMVDIADTKSMWYGESEKKIKEVFDTYRTAVDNSEIAPILLFNESDAVIGKRKEIGSANHTIDQTENTIQNIILQEMENLLGILIATTNLTQNMDSAFERRFLYKITFDKPSIESRKGIWNSMLPDLPDEKAEELSKKFELSGGQIENIARKIEVDAIINESELCMDTLLQYCKDELQNGLSTGKRIGFGE
jgi:ribosomal protein S19E (S16A)